MKIIPLSEGSFTIDKSKLFVPFNEEEDVLNDRPTGSLLVEVQPFVLVTKNDILLLDTGLGFKNENDEMQLHANLKAAGIQPEEVTKVLLTHLHKDHAGGISFGENNHKLSFSNAKYYVQEREFDIAVQTGFPSYITEELEPLKLSDQIRFLHDDEGVIDEYISYKHTGAHSKHHQVFWIKEDKEIIFFGGDDAPQLQQMKIKYKTKYDFDADKAMQLRQQWWEQGTAEGWTFLFYHDIKIPTFKKG
ncbi:MAG: MBL fold metallo-hydrolase [Bacteroidota bacterium]|nr:MBL fold metallo-hydrolase [Bacteroidota bacterium]